MHSKTRYFNLFACLLSATGFITLFILMLLPTSSLEAGSNMAPLNSIIYVDKDAAGANDGSSWAAAYTDLQAALSSAVGGDEIWVATGVYTPGTTVSNTFQLIDDVALYGGFSGTETDRSQRNWETYVTVLSGDIDGDDTADADRVVVTTTNQVGDNNYHVVTGSGVTTTAMLDGFFVTAGQADGADPHNEGGGILNDNGSPTLTNLTVSGNSAINGGGGIANIYSNNTLTNLTVSGNSATFGGGIYNDYSDNTLTNLTVSGNSATNGGGISNLNTDNTLTNLTVSGNSATTSGGGIYNIFSDNTLVNAIVSHNTVNGDESTISASINNDNNSIPDISYSIIANSGGSGAGWEAGLGTDGGNNLDADPLFVAAVSLSAAPTTTGNLQLQTNSLAIDAGNTLSYTSPITTDVAGNDRIQDGTIDMGAYEFGAYDLESQFTGTGSGSISKSPDLQSYPHGTVVTLTATADTGSTFTGWSGACSGTADCVLTMTEAKSVTATFTLNEYALTATTNGTGSGSISKSPDLQNYPHGTVVILTATADIGSTFIGWSGACSGTADCVLSMTEAKSVTATFTLNEYPLTVNTNGTGSGSISKSPDLQSYPHDTVVTLTAVADSGSTFAGWSYACARTVECGSPANFQTDDCYNNTSTTCVVNMTFSTAIVATFNIDEQDDTVDSYTLTVLTDGSGSGSVSRSPDAPTYTHGTTVTLTAVPDAGSTFAGWQYACARSVECGPPANIQTDDCFNNTSLSCVVNMTFNTAIVATFDLEQSLQEPSDGSIITSNRPTFDWQGAFADQTDVVSYTLIVTDSAGTARTFVTTSEIFTPPDDLPADEYQWTVIAQLSNGSQLEADQEFSFTISQHTLFIPIFKYEAEFPEGFQFDEGNRR